MAPLQNAFVKTKQIGRRLIGNPQPAPPTRFAGARVVLNRSSLDQPLGIGIGIENDDALDRCVKDKSARAHLSSLFNFSVVKVIIEQVQPNSVAASAGLEIGDVILAVDDCAVDTCTRDQCLELFKYAGISTLLYILPAEA